MVCHLPGLIFARLTCTILSSLLDADTSTSISTILYDVDHCMFLPHHLSLDLDDPVFFCVSVLVGAAYMNVPLYW